MSAYLYKLFDYKEFIKKSPTLRYKLTLLQVTLLVKEFDEAIAINIKKTEFYNNLRCPTI